MATLLRRPAVEKKTGHSRTTIYRLMDDGTFPRPVKIGAKAVAWVKTDVERYIANRIAASRGRAAA